MIANFRLPISNLNRRRSPQNHKWQPAIGNGLLGLFMSRVLTATSAELAEFQAIRRGLLVLGRRVVPTLAIGALKHNIIAWHLVNPLIGPISSEPIRPIQ